MNATNWLDFQTGQIHLPDDTNEDQIWCAPDLTRLYALLSTSKDPTCALCRWHFDDPSVTLADIRNSGVV